MSEITFSSVEEYRNSDKYAEFRNFCFQRDGYQCRICGNKINLNAHHVDYSAWRIIPFNGVEIETDTEPHHLVTLCHECHEKVHSIHKEYNAIRNRHVKMLESRIRETIRRCYLHQIKELSEMMVSVFGNKVTSPIAKLFIDLPKNVDEPVGGTMSMFLGEYEHYGEEMLQPSGILPTALRLARGKKKYDRINTWDEFFQKQGLSNLGIRCYIKDLMNIKN